PDQLNPLGLHLADYLDEVLRRGRNTRTVLERADLDEAEAGQQIDEIRMVDDDLAAAHRLHQLGPAIHFPIELLQERLAVFLERGTVVRSQAREPIDDVLRDDRREPRLKGGWPVRQWWDGAR